MEEIKCRMSGTEILLSNPQAVDPFNKYAREMKKITAKRKKTDEDLLNLRKLEIASKTYFDDNIKVYVPSSWIMMSLGKHSNERLKIAKAKLKSFVFVKENKLKLHHDKENLIKTLDDVVLNEQFHEHFIVKQGQVKVPKSTPIFKNWSFNFTIEFDTEMIDKESILQLLKYVGPYNGYGDFRPNYGRARFEELSADLKIAA